MAIEAAHYLGFERPALDSAVDFFRELIERLPERNLSQVLVVVPVSRAGRRLLERLVTQIPAAGLAPPKILTPAQLPEELYVPNMPVASRLRCLLVRMAVLRQASNLHKLIPHAPSRTDHAGWYALAEALDDLAATLAAENRTVEQVLQCDAASSLAANEEARWQVLAKLEDEYHDALKVAGLIDPQHARLEAITGKTCDCEKRIVLLACPDLSPQAASMLRQVSGAVRPVIHAEASQAEGFDELGALRAGYWRQQAVELSHTTIRFVDSAQAQGEALVETIAEGGEFCADQITVGAIDATSSPTLTRALDWAGIASRDAAGRPWGKSRVAMFLRSLARFARNPTNVRFDDLAELLRHVDVESCIEQTGGDREATALWLTLLDRYATDHLQARLSGTWLGDAKTQAKLKRLHDTLTALLPREAETERALGAWSEAIAEACRTVYGGFNLNRQSEEDHDLIRALTLLAETLTQQAELDEAAPDTPQVDFSQAIELTLARLINEAIPPVGGDAAVELVGLLELPLDDGAQMIVTSVNEQFIPGTRGADAFLPDHFLAALGMRGSGYLYARDLLLLMAAVQGRASVTLIAPRVSAQGDPLDPSRLLLACDGQKMLERINGFYREKGEATARILVPGGENQFIIPPPFLGEAPLSELSVTAFRQYLACPYRFYLQYVLRLGSLDDQAVELDPLKFGTLVHESLQAFGVSELRDSRDVDAISAFLDEQLTRQVRSAFGNDQRPAVRVQVAQARERLENFAKEQAKLVESGWRIETVERTLSHTLDIDGQPFTIRGKIDRIDRHESGLVRILDYKTSDKGKTPKQTHRGKRDGTMQWVDLQLPLYLDLIKSLEGPIEVGDAIELAYFNLPRKAEEVKVEKAEWTEDELAEAFAVRDQVIRNIRDQIFWPPGEPATYGDAFTRVCQDEAMNRHALAQGAAAREGRP